MLGRKVGSKECPQENSSEIAWWLIFGTLFGYLLEQKSLRGKELLLKAPLGLEDPFWLIFGTLFGYPLGQKSRRGTPEAQGLEHKVQGPEHMSQICSRPCAPAPLDGSLGRLLGALMFFLVQSVFKKGAKRMSERGPKGGEK